MIAPATSGFICLAFNFAGTTLPFCIHERNSLWKTGCEGSVAADGLNIVRVLILLVNTVGGLAVADMMLRYECLVECLAAAETMLRHDYTIS